MAVALAVTVAAVDVFFCLACDRKSGGIYPPLDDAYIFAQTARNFATGQGWSFNPGEPTASCTSPLFTLLLSFVGKPATSVDEWLWAGRVLGIAFHVFVSVLLFVFAAARMSNLGAAGLLTMAVMCQGSMVWGAASGMEITLAAFLALAILVLHLRLDDCAVSGAILGLLLGLLILVRPDACPLAALVALDRLASASWQSTDEGRRLTVHLRRSWSVPAMVLAGTAMILAYIVFARTVGVSPIPNSFAAKVGFQGYAVTLDYWRDALFLFFTYSPLLFVAFAVSCVLGFRLWLKGEKFALWACPLVLLASQSVGNPHLYNHGRYVSYCVPLMGAAIAVMIGQLNPSGKPVIVGLAWAERWMRVRVRRWAMVWTFLALGVLFAAYSVRTWATKYTEDQAFITDNYVKITEYLRALRPPVTRVAAHDIGYLGFVGAFRVYDLAGLATPEAIGIRRLPRAEVSARLWRDLQEFGAEAMVTFDRFEIINEDAAKHLPVSIRIDAFRVWTSGDVSGPQTPEGAKEEPSPSAEKVIGHGQQSGPPKVPRLAKQTEEV